VILKTGQLGGHIWLKKKKVKVAHAFNLVKHDNINGILGHGCIGPCLLQHVDGVSSQQHTLAAFSPQGKSPWLSLERMLGGPQSQSG
jgi:hypothetical protein